jgi:hypothetical protein
MIYGEEMADDDSSDSSSSGNGFFNNDDDDIFVFMGGDQEVPLNVRRAKIDESIDTISYAAFAGCDFLIELEGHNNLKIIEEDAFIGCDCLRRLKKMNGVKEIEANAFYGCNALSHVDFDKLEIIGELSLYNCRSLRSINLPSIRRIRNFAFKHCGALTDAVFGKDLEGIDLSAFDGCTALRRIVVPLKRDLFIYWNAFNRCDSLSRVDALIGGIHNTISSLHIKSWRDEMKKEIDKINQILPGIPASDKGGTIRQWMRSLHQKKDYYKTEHRILVKEAMTLLELALWKANLDENEFTGVTSQDEGVRVTRGQRKRARREVCITSGAGIIIKNVLPFLELK